MKKIIIIALSVIIVSLILVDIFVEYIIRIILYLPVKILFSKDILADYPPLFFCFIDWLFEGND